MMMMMMMMQYCDNDDNLFIMLLFISFWEARKIWGTINNVSRNLARTGK